MADPFRYSKAVVCGVAAALPEAALRQCEAGQPVDLQKAREQHREYVEVLRNLIPEVRNFCWVGLDFYCHTLSLAAGGCPASR